MPIVSAKTNKDFMPFQTALMGTPLPQLPNVDAAADPCVPALIQYAKNPHGRYIFGNNPEMLAAEDLNVCNLRVENMAGRYDFTFEHSNYTGRALYAGFRLVNNGAADMVVTVTNIGYQYEGEWLGARSWSDFYNLKFERPADYLDENGRENWYYQGQDFLDYKPRVFLPETYRVPPGQYIWVFGGTTADNFQHANVGGTADALVPPERCMNAAASFEVVSGENVTGSLYFYTDAALLDEKKPQQGYVTTRGGKGYARQYKGVDPARGLIEASIAWTVNDKTPWGRLPVQYHSRYDPNARRWLHAPYEAYEERDHVFQSDSWWNGVNPNGWHAGVGVDMTDFHCVDTEGKPLCLDCAHADATGKPGNFGNWMITYHDNYTFYNAGDSKRIFRIYKKDLVSGSLIVAVRDRDGNVLRADLKCHPILEEKPRLEAARYEFRRGIYWPIINGKPYYELTHARACVAEVTVPPRSVEQITVEYLLLGNSNGGMLHWVELDGH